MKNDAKALEKKLAAARSRIEELEARIREFESRPWCGEMNGEDVFHRIFRESSSPMLIVDPDMAQIVDCNNAAASFYGYEPEKLRSMPIASINQMEPESLRMVITQAESLDRNHFFFRHRLASGEVRDVEVYTGPIEIRGKRLLFSIIHDITERRRAEQALRMSEERLRMALDVSSIAVWDWDAQNDRMLRIVQQGSYAGLDPEYMGTTFQDFIDRAHPVDQPHLRRAIDATVAHGEPYRVEYRILGPDGEAHHMRSKAEPQRDVNGKVVRVVGVTQNMTAEKRAAEELMRARDEAEAANRSKSAFLANMSHEIRTPLSGVLGMLELMSMADVPDSFRELLDNATNSGRTLKELLSDILDLSKIEAGKLELEAKPFDLAEMAENSIRMFQDRAHARGIELVVDTSELSHPIIVTDPVRTRQILFNLVGNAVKFTDIGAVTLTCCNLPAHGVRPNRVLITVCDTGVGIPQPMMQRIFEPFTQLDDSHAKRFQGTGLGLSIVRRIVELMDGGLLVDSEVAKGTDIAVCLPVMLEPEQNHILKRAEEPVPVKIEPLRILLAEDDAVNRLAATRMLEKQGHEVTSVTDGTQVLDTLQKTRFDCVLMDVQMPILDGVEATRLIRWAELRGDVYRVPVIALTAYAMKGDEERFLGAGMDGYIAKPLDMNDLNRVLGRFFS